MAFQTSSNVSNLRRGNDENWKSDAFINISLPTKKNITDPTTGEVLRDAEGNPRVKYKKLGAIGLKFSREADAQIIQMLQEDPSRITQLMAKAAVDFRMVEADEDNAFDLPV